MKIFDLHCDALTKLSGFDDDALVTTTSLGKQFDAYTQVFAVYVSDNNENLSERARKQLKTYKKIKDSYIKSGCTPLLSVENASAFGDNLIDFDNFIDAGLKIASLTHNLDNEYACGASTAHDTGITQKGKELIALLEEYDVALDISHLSFNSIYDVLKCAKKPVCATHSNSFEMCPHKRNLTDDMFKEIVNMGGVVGINMYPDFLGRNADSDTVIKHIMHFLSLGGEKTLAFGCDFDGIEKMPFDIKNLADLRIVREKLENCGIDLKIIDDIYYNNAYNYIKV